jgi:hypothetical protein
MLVLAYRSSVTPYEARAPLPRFVLAEAAGRRDGVLPRDVPGVPETFADDLDLVAALQLRWHTRLSGAVERSLSAGDLDLEDAVVRAYRESAAQLPGVRLVLDACVAEPESERMRQALDKATRKEAAFLAAMAGRASAQDAGAVPAGLALVRKAREQEPAAA